MGLIKAATGAAGGTLADQWKGNSGAVRENRNSRKDCSVAIRVCC